MSSHRTFVRLALLGIATLNDVLEGIAGDLGQEHPQVSENIVKRPDGSWLVDGRVAVETLAEQLKLTDVAGEYHTAAGFVLDRLAHIPVECETLEIPGWRIEILDMDNKRIDKLLFMPLPQTADDEVMRERR